MLALCRVACRSAATAARPLQVRHVSTMLIESLASAVEQEKREVEPHALEPSFNGYELEHDAGSTEIVFKKSTRSQEVSVTVNVAPEEDEDLSEFEDSAEEDTAGEEDDDLSAPVYEPFDFEVNISKAGKELRFDCSTRQGLIDIHNVAFLRAPEEDEENSYCMVPTSRVTDKVHEGFDEYINSLGVDSELLTWISDHIIQVESEEYKEWCQDLQQFLR